VNTKGEKRTVEIISNGNRKKMVFKIARKKPSLEMSRLRRGKFLIHCQERKKVTAVKIA